MATNSENRPGQSTWLGLQTNAAPLNLNSGALTEAKDVLIRDGSQIEQRPGLQAYTFTGVYLENGFTNLPTCALNTRKVAFQDFINIATTFEEKVLATVRTSQGLYLLADEGTLENQPFLTTRQKNHWGYPLMIASSGTGYPVQTVQTGMNMGDSRIVSGMFTTHMTPGQLINDPRDGSMGEFDPVLGTLANVGYNRESTPLGVPSCSYLETSLEPASVNTGMWVESDAINSWAYRFTLKIKEIEGIPSPRDFVVTPVAPKITNTVTTTVNATQIKAVLTTATNHGLVVGNVVKIKDASLAPWKGVWTITEVSAANQFAVVINTTVSTAATVNQWAFATQTKIKLFRPKEQIWSSHYLEGYLGKTQAEAKLFGDFHTRAHFQFGMFNLYRTKVTSSTVEVGVLDPGDEMLLVDSTTADYGDLNVGWTEEVTKSTLSFTDKKSDDQLDKFLYTNPSQGGIIGGNAMPPSARVLESYKDTMFWANIDEPNLVNIQIKATLTKPLWLVTNSDNHPSTDHPFYILALEPKVTENVDGLEFASYSTGNPATDIEEQARSLCRIINSNAKIPFKAAYTSGFSDEPGKVDITYVDYSVGSITLGSQELKTKLVSANEIKSLNLVGQGPNVFPTTKRPLIPAVTFPAISEKRTKFTNRIYWSKPQVAGACPKANTQDLPLNVEIMAMRATSQGMYVVTDRGIWMLSGTSGPWDIREHDLGAKCWAQGSVAEMADTLFVLTTQGVQMFGSGQVISLPINNLILPIRNQVKRISMFGDQSTDTTEPWINATVDPFNLEYQLMVPKDGDADGFWLLRYNMTTQAWTVTDRNLRAGMYFGSNDTNRMLYADADRSVLLIERRDDTDPLAFSDEAIFLNPVEDLDKVPLQGDAVRYYGFLTQSSQINEIIKVGDYVVVINDNDAGDGVQNIEAIKITKYKKIIRNLQPTFEFEVEREIPLEADDRDIMYVRSFSSRVGFAPFFGGDPAMTKKFTGVHVHLNGSVRELDTVFHSDQRKLPASVNIKTFNPLDGWGARGWGEAPWGDETLEAMPSLDTLVPLGCNVDRSLNMTIENNGFNQDLKIQRVSVDFDLMSKRAR